jgi:serine/threonine-protein kinase
MNRCGSCNKELQPSNRFCPSCGAPAAAIDPDSVETVAMVPAQTPSSGRASAAVAFDKQRFAPGTLIASRYRIISRLGKGGMGEVFRADDLILGQTVALKFLPDTAGGNVNLLTRFYDEVRIARQIAHKNVCRVYDIGEIEGQPYLSMEYIDGEDLAGLLRRIGRLPSDKAVEFSRKLCAGLAAAHAQGVLHRDLKPANIMIDSRGEVRITDFGLAAIAEHLQGAEIRNGTPAYMAPEQLAGREVSAQSDIYALGLVLYEMFTGKPPFQADTIAEMMRLRQESKITNPSTMVPELDKAAERAILRCLDPEPKNRPNSALALAAMLPGGDPLAEALAAGETPSPEMVAAAGSNEGLHPKVAVPVLAGIAIMLATLCIFWPKVTMVNRVPLENPPEVLAAKARDLVRSIGYTERPADTGTGFETDGEFDYLKPKKLSNQEWTRILALPPFPLFFCYRQSPTALAARDIASKGHATLEDPPNSISGMVTVCLDVDGRLRWMQATPPQFEEPGKNGAPTDWAALFAAARLDPAQFQSTEPQWTPLAATDSRFAWSGVYPGRPDLPVRIEAASFHGKPVFFKIVWPWSKPDRMPPSTPSLSRDQWATLGGDAFFLLTGIAGCIIARYNWKAGRGDMRGAIRIGTYVAGLHFLSWLLGAHHVSSPAEQELFLEALAEALASGFLYWIFYLALEPWVRRYWPQTLISWSRLLTGRWRDPLIGRDILFAVLFGLMYQLLILALDATFLHIGAGPSVNTALNNLMGSRLIAQNLVQFLLNAITAALRIFLSLFVLRALLRKQWLAATALVVIYIAIDGLPQGEWYLLVPFFAAIYGILVVIMLRFGILAVALTIFVVNYTNSAFVTMDLSAWYGQSSIVVLVILIGLAAWGFKQCLGEQPILAPTRAAD